MELRILGLLEVVEGSRSIEVPGTKLRRLLAALVIHVNQVVSADVLKEILWGAEPPRTSANTLQTYISQLRKALGSSTIETWPPGYLLAVDPATIDARRFEDLLGRARAATAAHEPETAGRLLVEGLSLWRGHALADFRYDSFAQAEATRLEELRMVATEELLDAELASGRHAEAVGQLRALVEAHPLRERLWAQLMVALYRCGRQAEALRAFGDLRRLLGKELGIEPSPELSRLESDVLLQKPSLDWSPPVPAVTSGTDARAGVAAPAISTPQTRYAKSGDMHIAYQVTGGGDVDVLVVPGWISHLESQWEDRPYRRFMERLGASARVIRFDKRNMGLSDRIGDSMPPLEDRMDDLRAVMDAASSDRAVVMGVSEGSALSILFAASCPERVAGLVLMGGSARLAAGPDYGWGMTAEAAEALRSDVDRYWGTGVTLPLIHPSGVGDSSVLEWWSRFERMAASPGAAIATAAMCLQTDVRDLLPALRVPTLVLHRRDDLLVDAGHGRYLAEHIPYARYAELPGNDHWPWIGDADSVLREIEAFLAAAFHRPQGDAVLATVLFVEVPGAAAGRGVMREARKVLARALTEFRGRGASGDDRRFLATFDGPARAIRCALAVCDGLRRLGLDARAGIHIGEVHMEGPNVSGVAVEVAVEVLRAAGPGEVVVSRTVRDIVAGSGIALLDRGPLEVTGVPGDWHVFVASAV